MDIVNESEMHCEGGNLFFVLTAIVKVTIADINIDIIGVIAITNMSSYCSSKIL